METVVPSCQQHYQMILSVNFTLHFAISKSLWQINEMTSISTFYNHIKGYFAQCMQIRNAFNCHLLPWCNVCCFDDIKRCFIQCVQYEKPLIVIDCHGARFSCLPMSISAWFLEIIQKSVHELQRRVFLYDEVLFDAWFHFNDKNVM